MQKTNLSPVSNTSKIEKKFQYPFEISSTGNSFNIKQLLPDYLQIPPEFGSNKWNDAVCKWFYQGANKSDFTAKAGIDREKAFTHLRAIITSWDLKHEHKTMGAAFLMSLWFSDVKI